MNKLKRRTDWPICAWCRQPSCQRHQAAEAYFIAVMEGTPEEREAAFAREVEVFELCRARQKSC